MLKMFCNPEHEDAIQQTHLLMESMRSKDDPWLMCVLNADRYGEESWEMHCFVHGFPTRNPGSWLPSTNPLACGNATCKSLPLQVWPPLWRKFGSSTESWLLRQDLECDTCKAERRRRCCVLREKDAADVRKFQAPPFTTAPYVHPFRRPSYHATQLRALHLAKMQNRRLLWCFAFDRVKGTRYVVVQPM